ncbi:MAG: hypothetical protein NUV75_01050 [Gallionella sp.]|nr:hypothetical protein [Gallionella sp.]
MQTAIRNFLLAAGFLAVAIFYYWMNWSAELPILGGDHAVYLLTADHMSPFSDRGYGVTRAAMSYSYFPPLYPLILGITGGTSAHVEIAHAVTVTFLIIALAWYFVWARHEIQSSYQAFFLTVVFALLPTTFFQSFGILSENLYLSLTLIAIWLLTKPDAPLSRLYAASVVIGLAVITRTIGVALVVAFAIHLFLYRRDQWARLVFVSLLPFISWNVLKSLLGYTGGYLWILTRVLETTPLYELLLKKLVHESHGLWVGWITSIDHTPTLMALIVGSAIGIICLAGTVHRAYRRKFDGIYLILYFVVLLLWPSSPDARRFLYPVLPILLLHGLDLTSYLMQRFSPIKSAIYGYTYLFIITLITFPAAGLIFHRLAMSADDENKEYANSLYWYSGQDLNRARLKIKAYKKLTLSWQRISEVVPEGECVYNVDPTWLMLYANIPSYSTPQASTKDQFFKAAKDCRYFYVASYTRPPYQLFYPSDYIMGEGKIVFIDRMAGLAGDPVLGMLVEMPRSEKDK